MLSLRQGRSPPIFCLIPHLHHLSVLCVVFVFSFRDPTVKTTIEIPLALQPVIDYPVML